MCVSIDWKMALITQMVFDVKGHIRSFAFHSLVLAQIFFYCRRKRELELIPLNDNNFATKKKPNTMPLL